MIKKRESQQSEQSVDTSGFRDTASKFAEETRLRNKLLNELKMIREEDLTKVKKRNETNHSSIEDELDPETR
jgi:hypothetical protein